jgi:FkbM family methyltransferase
MNIGWFSLHAAAMGHPVVAFEPNPANRLRMCESLSLNDFTGVSIYPNAVGHKSNTTVELKFSSGSPGSASALLLEDRENKKKSDIMSLPTKMVTLDFMADQLGWISNQEPIALLKIDVEGFDYEVLLGSQKLLRSHLIENVFVELPLNREVEVIQGMFQILMDSGYNLHIFGGWNGKQVQNAPTFRGDVAAFGAAAHAYAQKSTYGSFNLWWKLQPQ